MLISSIHWSDSVIRAYIYTRVFVVVSSPSHVWLLGPYGLWPARLLCLWNFPGKNTGVGCHFLLQRIFPTQGLNSHHLCLLHCRRILYPLSHSVQFSSVAQSCPTLCNPMDCSLPGSSVCGISQARILEWVAISFSRGSSWPRDWTHVSCIVGRCFTIQDCIFMGSKITVDSDCTHESKTLVPWKKSYDKPR